MASLARSVFTISHHLAKESPRNDGRMKDASKETLVLAEDCDSPGLADTGGEP
jgi:hypothetical protein